MEYTFDEDTILQEALEHIKKTYSQHYANGSEKKPVQVMDLIIDSGRGIDFALGNVIKYATRHGKKGSAKDARTDLLKLIHYAVLAIYSHDMKERQNEDQPEYIGNPFELPQD